MGEPLIQPTPHQAPQDESPPLRAIAPVAPRLASPPAAPAPIPRRRDRLWRGLSIGAAVIAVVGALAGALVYRRAHQPKAARFETVQVSRGRIVARVTASGTLSALVTVQVGSQVSGRIQELLVDFNSRVKKGQVIARIDPRLFRAALEQAQASLAAARGNLAKAQAQATDARRQYLRSRALHEQRLIAQSEFETTETNWRALEAQVAASEGALAQARAAEHQAQINLDYTTIASPIEGVVISRNVDVGQTVAATLQSPVLFQIAEDLRKMQVDTSVAESDVGKLREGMAATFTVDAYGSEAFRGVVRQVRNAPQVVQNVVTYDAVIDVANPDLRLRPGMTANVTFVYAEKADVLRVPNAALRFRAPDDWLARAHIERRTDGADRRTVWAQRPAGPAPVPIRTGISDGTSTELIEGDLGTGDALITDAGGASAVPAAMRRVL